MFKIHPFYFNASEIFENSNRISCYFVTSNSSWTVFLSAMVQSHFNEIIVWCPSPGPGSGASFSINYLNWIYIFIKSTIQGIEQSMFIRGIMKIPAAKSAGIKNQLFVLFLISNLTEITVTHIAIHTIHICICLARLIFKYLRLSWVRYDMSRSSNPALWTNEILDRVI